MAPAELSVEVVYSPAPGVTHQAVLQLPQGSTVQAALAAAYPGLALPGLTVGVWGRVCALGDALRNKDRVEVYRPLLVDPKEARRQRYQSHRAKARR